MSEAATTSPLVEEARAFLKENPQLTEELREKILASGLTGIPIEPEATDDDKEPVVENS